MTTKKLLKYINKGSVDADLKSTPVVISDSKGNYLKNLRTDISAHQKIVWYCKAGLKSFKLEKWLGVNLTDLCRKHGQIVLYIWVGTCDFTCKEGRFISLSPDSEKVLSDLKQNFLKIKAQCEAKNIKVTFLQVPYYSIQIWNRNKRHSNPESFKADDFKLTTLIDSANSFIQEVNSQMSTCSPKFCQDMVRSRKKMNSVARYSINFGLLRDGIHPSETLSRAWLFSIIKMMCKDCV